MMHALLVLALTLATGTATALRMQQSSPAKMAMYKTATCGCCAIWGDHMRKNGFEVAATDMAPGELAQVKTERRVPGALRTCHTAVVNGYVIEGHVPADVVQKLLAERPKVAGIAVAGMPLGSPGMEQGSRKDPYEVMAFTADGATSVFARK